MRPLLITGVFSKAAGVLNLTQSALSHQLKEAETQHGTKFFTRSNRKLNLTPAGRLVYEASQKILPELDKLESNLKHIHALHSGTIRVSAACSTSYHWLPYVLKSFREDFPNVDVDIVIENSTNPVQEIIKGKIDLSVMITPISSPHIDYRLLFEDEMVVVFSKAHRFNHKQYLIAQDFENEHLIIHSRPLSTVVFYEKILKPHAIEPRKISELPLTEATIELIRSNYGIAVMPKWSIAPYVASGTVCIKKINRKGLFRSHYAAILKSEHHPNYLHKFISYLGKGLDAARQGTLPEQQPWVSI
ncbi:MAG: LysR substrate-binding domain-containing protein [Breznakibacter sp.]